MQVIVFEDEKVAQLMPLVGLKPVFGLFSGTMSLKERFETSAAGRVVLTWHLRRHIAQWFGESHPGALVNTVVDDDILLLNGRLVCDERAIELVSGSGLQPGQGVTQAGSLVACRVKAADLTPAGGLLPDVIDSRSLSGSTTCVESSGFLLIENIWDPVSLHPDLMRRDRSRFRPGCREGEVHPSAVLVNPEAISIGKGAVVMAGAVLDASEGYIHIGQGAVVEPQAVLMQNVVLAQGARAKIGAKIYSNVYVGSASKAGGEIEDSIIEPFANKQHDGFLGHSYISAWCNLGAATNTSDLKNNYSKVSLVVGGRQLPTGLQFLGLIMGEHSKSAIGSLFNTGTVVGTAANIFGVGMPPKYVPSFSWGNGHPAFEACRIDNVVETARRVMGRRRIPMSPAYEEMFRKASMLEPAADAKL
jgi:UDP-N-acetylglucosamine diphosphorylase / glucose-1-phosphate thymidylyltransferase / UDP-N-acetylgalactosamine diphosphorylase / glucosamine-1-phosphate N-acetyltransferase / galactosamine-1-phosphate N-acetyltransferase